MNWGLLKNSLEVSLGATLAAGLFGIMAALWASGLTGRARRWVLFLAAVPLLWPPFLVLNCWLNLLGDTGVWRSWFPFSILSLGGAVWVLALLKWPVIFFLALGAWSRLDPSLLAADLRLRGWPLFRWLLWPQARASVALGFVITFVLCINDLSVPSILQVKVFTTEIWISFNTTFKYGTALRASWPLVFAPLLLLLVFRRSEISLNWRSRRDLGPLLRGQLGSAWPVAAGFSILVLAFSIVLPSLQLTGEDKTWRELASAWAAGTDAFAHSFIYAAGSVLACLGLAAVLHAKKTGFILWFFFFLPGVVLGIILIFLLNRSWLRGVAQTGWIVLVAFAIRYGALAWSALRSWTRSVPANLDDDCRIMGARAWTRFRHLFWPTHGPRLLGLAYIIYLLVLWDVETLIMIVPAGGETLALRIFNLLHYGHNGQVNALCLILLLLGAAPLCCVALLQKLLPAQN